jgi:hypothetical protein
MAGLAACAMPMEGSPPGFLFEKSVRSILKLGKRNGMEWNPRGCTIVLQHSFCFPALVVSDRWPLLCVGRASHTNFGPDPFVGIVYADLGEELEESDLEGRPRLARDYLRDDDRRHRRDEPPGESLGQTSGVGLLDPGIGGRPPRGDDVLHLLLAAGGGAAAVLLQGVGTTGTPFSGFEWGRRSSFPRRPHFDIHDGWM